MLKNSSEWIRHIKRERSLKPFFDEAFPAIKNGTMAFQEMDHTIENIYPAHNIGGRTNTIQVEWKKVHEFQEAYPQSKLTRNLLVRKCFARPMELPHLPIPVDALCNAEHARDLGTVVELYLQKGYRLEAQASGVVKIKPIRNARSQKGWSQLSKSSQLVAVVQHAHGHDLAQHFQRYLQSINLIYNRDDGIQLFDHRTKTYIGYFHSGIDVPQFQKDWLAAMQLYDPNRTKYTTPLALPEI
jgi:hypothetical protein